LGKGKTHKICPKQGVNWGKENDEIIYKLDEIRSRFAIEKITKRNVLKTIASTYDPLGLINPVVVSFKVYFQKLCKEKLGWDEKTILRAEKRMDHFNKQFKWS